MVLDNLFSLIGLGTNKQMNAVMNASMNAVPTRRKKTVFSALFQSIV